MLLAVTSIKLIAEIALLALLGRWVLGLLAGAKRDSNPFYQLLSVITSPVEKLTRAISPRLVLDRHIPLAAGLLMLSLWLLATVFKIGICAEIGVEQCR